ncbi:sensor histidine kinase [Paenibacillus harenae]|uniref:sensor histidine kinase n=1 Tax=Paenibacillus harenae TaxID=306543 RepID=UPI0003FFDFB5|nr:histidine kinase [Paenibacillus harenae]
MFKQYRTFYSILVLIFLTTVIVLSLYTYTINTSLKTVRTDIQSNNLNRLRFVVNNLDHNVQQLTMLSMALETDAKVGLLPSIHLLDNYDQVKLMMDLTDKMNLQSFSEGWNNQVSIYSHILGKWIGSTATQEAPPGDVSEDDWILEPVQERFSSYRIHEGYTIRVTFPVNNLREMLDRSRVENNNPFFYFAGNPIISNHRSNDGVIRNIMSKLIPFLTVGKEGTEAISVDGTEYLVTYLRSDALGWYLINYLPMDEALKPITRTQIFFYITCAMLFLAGAVIALFLYRKVQVPLLTLLKGVRLLKHGNFSFRIKGASRNEFDFLYDNFNEMAAQIEDLIEKVYKEKIASREAMVKQLQAQINPHFLYNCLFFINNMTRLGNDEAVTAMTQNLAEYFRYSTRLDEPTTTLEKELSVVNNYLRIQCLRMARLRYEIDIPDGMMRLSIPKLLIQPLVENSVIHGIEKKMSAGLVRITGYEDGDCYRLVIEDDGKGMAEEDIRELLWRMQQPLDDSMGCALWNIRQRMDVHFAAPAGIEFARSDLGGLYVTLYWPNGIIDEGE